MTLSDVVAADVDTFYEHMAQRWSRRSVHTSAHMLRAWFIYCERQVWVRVGLAEAVLLPRIYRYEGLPLGPTWETVGRILEKNNGDDAASTRDHGILLLLSVYRLRSGEARGHLTASPFSEPAPRIARCFQPYIYSRNELQRLFDATAILGNNRWPLQQTLQRILQGSTPSRSASSATLAPRLLSSLRICTPVTTRAARLDTGLVSSDYPGR